MKKIIAALLLGTTLGAHADLTGPGQNGPASSQSIGPYEKLFTTEELSESATETLIEMSEHNDLKAIAKVIESDSQNYFQSGEMSLFLSNCVEKIRNKDAELSIDESVSILLDFANSHK